MAQKLRVLIVEDYERDAALLVRELQRGGYELTFERVETPQAMNAALANQVWDIVISDFAMPHFSAQGALALVRERQMDLPFIIVSGTVGEEAAVEAMRAGAHDFMPKGQFSRLLPAIEREMREAAGRVERRAIEGQLRRAQRMEAIGHLTGGIAHDFNNLLAVIIGNVDALLDLVRESPDLTEFANEVLKSAMHGADLTRRLLAFARQQPLSPEVVDLNERLPAIVTMLRRTLGESIHVSATLFEDLWLTLIDPSQVEDALLNLAINSRDAMPNGGALTIETANAYLDDHYALLHAEVIPGEYVALSVTDTGDGMSAEIIERAIEPFFTTKEPGKGTGLGLSMVYGFAKQSGGHLSIYSELGVGTTIRLYLPRHRGQISTRQSPSTHEVPMPSGGESILLVDDNAPLRRIAIRWLTGLGYKVRDAASGHAALAILEGGERFDLLFTDIGLPNGISGIELAGLAKQIQPALKILYTTGYAKVQTWNGDPSDEPHHLLRKPYRAMELAAKLRKALDDD
jgi:signal transduction histidine kinase